VVKQRLTHHLLSNHLLNSFQFAYIAHHSTEFTLLYVHYHIIKAMAQQKITALCLLDFSAAFSDLIVFLTLLLMQSLLTYLKIVWIDSGLIKNLNLIGLLTLPELEVEV